MEIGEKKPWPAALAMHSSTQEAAFSLPFKGGTDGSHTDFSLWMLLPLTARSSFGGGQISVVADGHLSSPVVKPLAECQSNISDAFQHRWRECSNWKLLVPYVMCLSIRKRQLLLVLSFVWAVLAASNCPKCTFSSPKCICNHLFNYLSVTSFIWWGASREGGYCIHCPSHSLPDGRQELQRNLSQVCYWAYLILGDFLKSHMSQCGRTPLFLRDPNTQGTNWVLL